MKSLKNILLAMLVLSAVLICCVACGGNNDTPVDTTTAACDEHIDDDEDGACDVCGEEVEEVCDDHIDTDEDNYCDICDAVIAFPLEFTVSLTDESKSPIAGASIRIMLDGDAMLEGVTDAEGKFAGELLPGSYNIYFDNMPEGWLVDQNGKKVKLEEGKTDIEFTALDNNPDGSEDKPYFVGTEPVNIEFTAGATLNFAVKGAEKYLIIENANVKVTYKDKEYLPENGKIRLLLDAAADTNSSTPFKVTSTVAGTVKVELESIPGTSDLPFEATLGQSITATIEKGKTVTYKWVADKDGYLLLESPTKSNHIMLYNTTSMVVTRYTDGAKSVFVAVKKGDSVLISVASKDENETNNVVFELAVHAATAADPLPLYEESTTIRITPKATIALSYDGAEKTLTLASKGITMTVNGTAVAESSGSYSVKLKQGDVIVLTSTATENTDIAVTLA